MSNLYSCYPELIPETADEKIQGHSGALHLESMKQDEGQQNEGSLQELPMNCLG